MLAEQRIAVSSISSPENVKKLQLLQISYIVVGNVDVLGTDYSISVKTLNVSSGEFFNAKPPALVGGSSREIFNGVNALMSEFISGITSDQSGAITREPVRPAATGIAIEVSTKMAGILYLQDEEIATLWENDTYSIPIERPGTYAVKMVFGNGTAETRAIAITSRGTVKVDFSLVSMVSMVSIGNQGPGGGIIFFAENGRCMECSGDLGNHSWNSALSTASACRGGGLNDWRLPTREELNLMYVNLKLKGLGDFGDKWYWSSSQYNNYHAWAQLFGDGSQFFYNKNNTGAVRVVRAF